MTPAAAAPVPPVAFGAPPAPRGTNGFGIAALILGIVAILGAAIPFLNIVSGILAVAGLILGIVGLTRKGTGKGTSVAGTIISGIALLVTIVASIFFFATVNAVIDDDTDEPVIQESLAPVPDQPAPDPNAVVGSFENPVPIGTGIVFTIDDVEQWVVTVESTVLNANDLVAAADPANRAPDAGFQYALVNLQIEHIGPGEGTPSNDLAVFFGTTPDEFWLESDVVAVTPEPAWRGITGIQQASISGNAIVQIPVGSAGAWGISPLGTDLLVFFANE